MADIDGGIVQAINDLTDVQLEAALSDFLVEQKLVGEFFVWVEKWKSNRRVSLEQRVELEDLLNRAEGYPDCEICREHLLFFADDKIVSKFPIARRNLKRHLNGKQHS